MGRIVLAGLAGGFLMFVWATIAHVALPLAQTGVSQMTDEAPALAALKTATNNKPGLYIFPGGDMSAKDAMAKMDAARKIEPSGIMVYQPPGAPGMTPKLLIRELVTEMIEALLAAALLAQTSIGAYFGRVGFMGLVGIVCAISTNVSYWNWYAFPLNYTLATMTIEIAGFLAASLAVAVLIRPRTA